MTATLSSIYSRENIILICGYLFSIRRLIYNPFQRGAPKAGAEGWGSMDAVG